MKEYNYDPLTLEDCEVIDQFHLVQWRTLDSTKEDELINLLAEIDTIIQYYDNADFGDDEFNEVGDEADGFVFDEIKFFQENGL